VFPIASLIFSKGFALIQPCHTPFFDQFIRFLNRTFFVISDEKIGREVL
jgi:hypothetical protein